MKRTLPFLILFLISACSSKEKFDTNSAEGAFKWGERLEENSRYDEAIAQYAQVKNKHPYTRFAPDAELKIADLHFKREAYIEAQNAYQLFKELRPAHPKIAYATFQLGLSYFKQLPSTIDRDLTLADKSILYFDEVIQSYTTSEFLEDAKANKAKALKMLGEKELYIADFYFIRKKYDSALGRYEATFKNFPGLGLEPRALYGAAMSAKQLKDQSKLRAFYQKLVTSYPNSDETNKLKKEVGSDI